MIFILSGIDIGLGASFQLKSQSTKRIIKQKNKILRKLNICE